MFVNVALNIPADKLFTYEVPAVLRTEITVGKRVFVPFGSRRRTGFVVEIINSCRLAKIRSIIEVLDEDPLFGETDFRFYRWIADYFMYPLGKTLAEIIPAGSEKKDFLWVTPLASAAAITLPAEQKNIFELLRQYPQGITVDSLAKISGRRNISRILDRLHLAGLLQMTAKQKKQLAPQKQKFLILNENKIAGIKLTQKQERLVAFLQKRGTTPLTDLIKEAGVSAAVIKRMKEKELIDCFETEKIRTTADEYLPDQNDTAFFLNARQQKVLREISVGLGKNIFTPILLHGVTGSGKTEVYLKAIASALENKGRAIYLVPEISLTPQLLSRIQGRFAREHIAVLHSGIAEAVRYDQWRRIKRGEIRLVVGARSAIFAPLPDLKLIIVDEEHDSSYKQDERLCYHSRDLAVMKAKLHNALVILGSATPGIRTYYNAESNKYHYLEIARRIKDKPLPQVEIIDMKEQRDVQGNVPALSTALIDAIAITLQKKEQVLLFLNKRGFDTFLVCADCGYNFRCPNCAVSLKNHTAEGVVKCHYCNYVQKALPHCPSCQSPRVLRYGTGIQKLEAEVKRIFPEAHIQRMDSDIIAGKGTQVKILQQIVRREIDILVGTQMVTKGHDFPCITLVGVVAADTALNMPDFRAAEKTFQQLTQVAGRGGRGNTPGRVIIQTFNPQHHALKHAQHHDYKSFYEEEIIFREDLKYPPFSRLINLRLSATNKTCLLEQAAQLGKMARQLCLKYGNNVAVIGPAESPLAKIKGRWRRQLLLKSENTAALHQFVRELLDKTGRSTIKITVDVDPENFM